jgi:hypothetical protein
MLRTGFSRRTMAVSLAAIAAVGCVGLAASPARATTTTSCTYGFTVVNTDYFNLICPGFVDSGAPYVFDVAELIVWTLPVVPPAYSPGYSLDNVVLTCPAYTSGTNGAINTSNCTA